MLRLIEIRETRTVSPDTDIISVFPIPTRPASRSISKHHTDERRMLSVSRASFSNPKMGHENLTAPQAQPNAIMHMTGGMPLFESPSLAWGVSGSQAERRGLSKTSLRYFWVSAAHSKKESAPTATGHFLPLRCRRRFFCTLCLCRQSSTGSSLKAILQP